MIGPAAAEKTFRHFHAPAQPDPAPEDGADLPEEETGFPEEDADIPEDGGGEAD